MAKIPLVFSQAGKGGSRRLLLIGGSAIAVIVLVTVLGTSHQTVIPASGTAKMGAVDALPGGLHSTPLQNNLAEQTDHEGAQRASETGSSYTPPLPPGVPVTPAQEAGVAPPAVQAGSKAGAIIRQAAAAVQCSDRTTRGDGADRCTLHRGTSASAAGIHPAGGGEPARGGALPEGDRPGDGWMGRPGTSDGAG